MLSARRPMPAACDASDRRQAERERPLAIVHVRAGVDAGDHLADLLRHGAVTRQRVGVARGTVARLHPHERELAVVHHPVAEDDRRGQRGLDGHHVHGRDRAAAHDPALPFPARACAAISSSTAAPVCRADGDVERAPLAGREPDDRAPLAFRRTAQDAAGRGLQAREVHAGPSIRHCHRCGSWRGSTSTATAMPPVGRVRRVGDARSQVRVGVPVAQHVLEHLLLEAVGGRRERVVDRQADLRAGVARHHLRVRAPAAPPSSATTG